MDVVVVSGSEGIWADTCTDTYLVHIVQHFLSGLAALYQSLGIVEISLGKAADDARTVFDVVLNDDAFRRNLLAQQVAVLGSIVGMRIVSAVHQEIVAAFFTAEPRVVETDGRIETRLPVAVHIVGTGSSDFVVVVLPFPVISPNFICSGKSAFHISGGRVGDRKSVLHKEGIHEGLGHSPASVTSAHNRGAVLFVITVITASRTGE